MGFTLEKVVPWGRSYDEYVSMFDLSGIDLGLRILGCGDGPAAFNTVLTKQGGNIVSIDPIYVFEAEQIGGASLKRMKPLWRKCARTKETTFGSHSIGRATWKSSHVCDENIPR